jgi:peptidyl-prolyl cis-trans isomerase B (cyclophilin B)
MMRNRHVFAAASLVALGLGAGTALAQAKPAGQPAAPDAGKVATAEAAKVTTAKEANPMVLMKTSMGDIKIELDRAKAPLSVDNFLRYVDEKFYDGTIFHRVIANFMIQGGGMLPDMTEKQTHEPLKNEAGNGLKNARGTLAMARTGVVDSATAQFFINVVDNDFLDHKDETPRGFGYAVFGKVVEGMDVVDKIKVTPTSTKDPYENVPVTPVVIESVRRVE